MAQHLTGRYGVIAQENARRCTQTPIYTAWISVRERSDGNWECIDIDATYGEMFPAYMVEDIEGVRLINLTPHALNLRGADGREVVIPPDGRVARVMEAREEMPSITIKGLALPVSRARYGDVEGLPEAADGVIYVVSALVLARVAGRNDVFAPGPLIRNEAGQPIGALGLSAAAE